MELRYLESITLSLAELRGAHFAMLLRANSGLPREARCGERSVVEMPGVEPGSNVCAMRLYGHDSSVSPARREEPRKGRRDDAISPDAVASGGHPTPLVTSHPRSEDRGRDVVRMKSDL